MRYLFKKSEWRTLVLIIFIIPNKYSHFNNQTWSKGREIGTIGTTYVRNAAAFIDGTAIRGAVKNDYDTASGRSFI
jgi:hypothetical protein